MTTLTLHRAPRQFESYLAFAFDVRLIFVRQRTIRVFAPVTRRRAAFDWGMAS